MGSILFIMCMFIFTFLIRILNWNGPTNFLIFRRLKNADRLRRSLAIDSNLVKPRVARSQRRVRHIFMEELSGHVPIFTRKVGTGKVVVLFFGKEGYNLCVCFFPPPGRWGLLGCLRSSSPFSAWAILCPNQKLCQTTCLNVRLQMSEVMPEWMS